MHARYALVGNLNEVLEVWQPLRRQLARLACANVVRARSPVRWRSANGARAKLVQWLISGAIS